MSRFKIYSKKMLKEYYYNVYLIKIWSPGVRLTNRWTVLVYFRIVSAFTFRIK